MFIDNTDFRFLMPSSGRIFCTYGVNIRYFDTYVLIYGELRSNILGFPETLGFALQ